MDHDGFNNHKTQLDGMQQNQSSLISDLRDCFSTYASIQEKFPDFQLKTHGSVLTTLLEILAEQMALTAALNVRSSTFDETVGQLDVLLQDKLLQISQLSKCFQSGDEQSKPRKTPDALLHVKNVKVEKKRKGNSSEDSFEDLRL